MALQEAANKHVQSPGEEESSITEDDEKTIDIAASSRPSEKDSDIITVPAPVEEKPIAKKKKRFHPGLCKKVVSRLDLLVYPNEGGDNALLHKVL